MQLEIQVALSFFISFLYNKLPRRRVNIFADELERAFRLKFASHWYPDRPFKGSAYRCLKTADPLDPVLELAAKESGLALAEIRQTLPEDLSIWIDPGEVSYRVGERGQVKLLYSESSAAAGSANVERCAIDERCDREVTSTFDPEAQSFRPIDALATSMSSLGLTGGSSSSASNSPFTTLPPPSPQPAAAYNAPSNSPAPAFTPRPRAPVTFTTAAFAQTKFGSTKLKSAGKRGNRMSPTEFSNYIKQRAMLQQPGLLAPFPPQQPMLTPSPLPEPPFGPAGPFSGVMPTSGMAPLPPGYGGGMGRAPARMVDAPPPSMPPLSMPDLLRPPSAPPLPPGVTSSLPGPMTSQPVQQLTPEGQQLLESLSYASNPQLRHLLVAN